MIYKQLSYLPIIFQVDEGIVLNVHEYLLRNKLSFTKVLVVSGQSFSKSFGDQLAKKNNWSTYTINNNATSDVEQLKQFALEHAIDLIIGVGGGKVIDTVKRVSYLTTINHLSIPTIISNDGLISPISVIKNEQGKTESLPGMMPMGVLIDIDIIQQSPIRFIRAAAGDLLSNISASYDWILAFKNQGESMNDIAFHLAKSAALSLIHYDNIDLKSKTFLRLVVQGQINSGIAMSLAGTSRPCSGSEHLISHALNFLDLATDELHGTQVATISLFTLFLHNKLTTHQLNYAKSTGIPLNFASLFKEFNSNILETTINKAREMRPGRHTILNELSNTQIVQAYSRFERALLDYENTGKLAESAEEY